MSNSLWPRGLQHTRPPCPSRTPEVYPNSCPSSRWCHPVISSSVVPFTSCPQSLPASESFPMSQLFAWGGQSTGVSALASFLPKNTQAPPSLGFSRQEHWSGLPLPSPMHESEKWKWSHLVMSGSRSVITPSWLCGSWRSFLYSSSVYSCHLFLISSSFVRSIPCLSFTVLSLQEKFPWCL